LLERGGSKKLKKVWKLLALVSLIFLLISCGKKKEEKPLVMGLSPIANSEKLLEDAAPLYKMLGDDIGRPVEGYIATNYIGVVEALGTGTIDFALIPPFAYILANKKNGSEALLTSIGKNDEPGYYSVLLVRTDSGIEKVEDLKGVEEAVKTGADIIMLDNMDIETIKKAIKIINKQAIIECSGNVDITNINRFKGLEIDYISSGAITHSAKILDLSLKNLRYVDD